jgi:hypothetical protein
MAGRKGIVPDIVWPGVLSQHFKTLGNSLSRYCRQHRQDHLFTKLVLTLDSGRSQTQANGTRQKVEVIVGAVLKARVPKYNPVLELTADASLNNKTRRHQGHRDYNHFGLKSKAGGIGSVLGPQSKSPVQEKQE